MKTQEHPSESLAKVVAGQILADITASNLKAGDLFMTGDAVIKRYSVSRSIAREAISRLVALGVLESRQRKGLLIARPDPVQLTQQWLPLYCRTKEVEPVVMLAQFRYVLEMGAIDLAVANATDEQIALFEQRVLAFESIAIKSGHTPEADQADLSLHSLILEMTGNTLIAGMHRVLSNYFFATTKLPVLQDASKAIREHLIMAESLRRRDRAMIRAILRAHLEGTLGLSAPETLTP